MRSRVASTGTRWCGVWRTNPQAWAGGWRRTAGRPKRWLARARQRWSRPATWSTSLVAGTKSRSASWPRQPRRSRRVPRPWPRAGAAHAMPAACGRRRRPREVWPLFDLVRTLSLAVLYDLLRLLAHRPVVPRARAAVWGCDGGVPARAACELLVAVAAQQWLRCRSRALRPSAGWPTVSTASRRPATAEHLSRRTRPESSSRSRARIVKRCSSRRGITSR